MVVAEQAFVSPGRLTAASAQAVANALLPYLGDARLVLDVGVGDGAGAVPLESVGVCVVALDIDCRALADVLGPAVCADAHHLPMAAGSVPVVHLSGVLHHTTDWRRVLAELARVVTDGGLVAAVLSPGTQDPLPDQVRRHLATALDLRLAPRPLRRSPDLHEAQQVDAELECLGFGPPWVLQVPGQLVTSARRLVAAASSHPATPAVQPADMQAAAAATLAWAATLVGGPDIEVLLPTGRVYRIYRKG